eukprot:Protomagalhaensia_wolfi_Nauph_80__1445@NODE_1870_length_1295_cov_496_632166_g1461_i0_p1_GENE_NODE_1870_length_1295_cov_496_632166_g1461_i0NODE_1870_length_1295_cov_496_632166_g1461_i0_p1_ORF_typecomplete_len257_score59_63_NODE_1870_length_1295_cov_496_632166_g1461_i04231193
MTRICAPSTSTRQRSNASLFAVGALQAMSPTTGAHTVSETQCNLDANWDMNFDASLRFRASAPLKSTVTQTQVAAAPAATAAATGAATQWVEITPIVATQFVSVPVVTVPVVVTPISFTPLLAVAAEPAGVTLKSEAASTAAALNRKVYDFSGKLVVESETGGASEVTTVKKSANDLVSILEALLPQLKSTELKSTEKKNQKVSFAEDIVQPLAATTTTTTTTTLSARDRLRAFTATDRDDSSSFSDDSTFSDLWD